MPGKAGNTHTHTQYCELRKLSGADCFMNHFVFSPGSFTWVKVFRRRFIIQQQQQQQQQIRLFFFIFQNTRSSKQESSKRKAVRRENSMPQNMAFSIPADKLLQLLCFFSLSCVDLLFTNFSLSK